MRAQVVTTKTYTLSDLDHETLRILDTACAHLVDAVREGRIGTVNSEKLYNIYKLIIRIASGDVSDSRCGNGDVDDKQ